MEGIATQAEPAEPAEDAQAAEDAETADLVARFQAGDKQAFAAIYSRYFDRVFAYMRLLLRSDEEAMDASQQVFLKAFEALPAYKLSATPLRGWLFTIARNHALKQLERGGRTIPEEPDRIARRRRAAHPGAELPPLDWVTHADLLMLIEKLPLIQRQVLVLRFMLDLSSAQAAAILERTPSDVRRLQARALAFIRERLLAISGAPTTPTEDRPAMRRLRPNAPVTRTRRWSLSQPG